MVLRPTIFVPINSVIDYSFHFKAADSFSFVFFLLSMMISLPTISLEKKKYSLSWPTLVAKTRI